MDAHDLLLNRASEPPRLQTEPAPEGADLEKILAAACRAPDHGRIRPWRFLVIRGEARVQLGEVFADALRAREPDAAPGAIKKELERPMRSPLIVTVVATPQPDHPKVPVIEQVVSAGVAAHSMILTAQALGFGGILLTGANAYDPQVKKALGLNPDDVIAAFVYLGTPTMEAPDLPRPTAESLSSEWTEPFAS